MMNANSHLGRLRYIEVSAYYIFNLVYLCPLLLEQQINQSSDILQHSQNRPTGNISELITQAMYGTSVAN